MLKEIIWMRSPLGPSVVLRMVILIPSIQAVLTATDPLTITPLRSRSGGSMPQVGCVASALNPTHNEASLCQVKVFRARSGDPLALCRGGS